MLSHQSIVKKKFPFNTFTTGSFFPVPNGGNNKTKTPSLFGFSHVNGKRIDWDIERECEDNGNGSSGSSGSGERSKIQRYDKPKRSNAIYNDPTPSTMIQRTITGSIVVL
jgi:hypothetical protein